MDEAVCKKTGNNYKRRPKIRNNKNYQGLYFDIWLYEATKAVRIQRVEKFTQPN